MPECCICNITKDISNFYKHELIRHKPRCKECMKNKTKKYYYKSIYYTWARKSIYTHKLKKCIINISTSDLEKIAKNTKYCNICGKNLNWNTNRKYSTNSPTLDRINNELLIDKSNVWILCRDCNTHKFNKPMRDFVEYCKMIVEKFG